MSDGGDWHHLEVREATHQQPTLGEVRPARCHWATAPWSAQSCRAPGPRAARAEIARPAPAVSAAVTSRENPTPAAAYCDGGEARQREDTTRQDMAARQRHGSLQARLRRPGIHRRGGGARRRQHRRLLEHESHRGHRPDAPTPVALQAAAEELSDRGRESPTAALSQSISPRGSTRACRSRPRPRRRAPASIS